jgi:mycoredoxin
MNLLIRMYSTSWCPDCRRARQFLRDRKLQFEEIDIEVSSEGAEFVMKANEGRRRVPTFDVNGRVFSSSPFNVETFARELGV